MRGALTRIGDTVDRLTGRRWVPSSSLATSELIERMKKLMDAEAKEVPGKGTVVPHNIKLKMQWDKFSTDADDGLQRLENELLAAAADHINDSLYYTYAPLHVEVKPDYFVEGVKLFVSFDKFADEDAEAEMNVTIAGPGIKAAVAEAIAAQPAGSERFVAHFELNGAPRDKMFNINVGGRLSIGRTGGNDLVIDDASISKMHASLVLNLDGTLSVADTGSTNGTFINGQRIAYGKATRLVEGDKVSFGVVKVVFEHIPAPEPVVEEAVPVAAEDDETVAIDGFEFRSRIATSESAPVIPMPDETLQSVSAKDENTEPVKSE